MIEPLPRHEDEWAYYESEPLFDYVNRVSDMMGETMTDINPDGSYNSTPPLQPFRFASDCNDGKIDTQSIRMDLYESPDVQDTLRAFGLDSSKFWYLCLFIKWRVDGECKTAFVFPKSGLEQLESLANELKKLSPEKSANLQFKIDGSKTINVDNGFALAALCDALINYLPETADEKCLSPNSYGLDEIEKVSLSTRTKIYLYHKYMSEFVSPLEAIKGIYASKDKSLLISRMIYIFSVCDDPKLYTDLNEKGYKKQNQLKGYLSRYKPFKFWHY